MLKHLNNIKVKFYFQKHLVYMDPTLQHKNMWAEEYYLNIILVSSWHISQYLDSTQNE